MAKEKETKWNSVPPQKNEERNHAYYVRLNRKFVFLTLVFSVVPLLLVGWAVNIHYSRFAKSRMIDSFQEQIENHRKIIELFLNQRLSLLQLVAYTHTEAYLSKLSQSGNDL